MSEESRTPQNDRLRHIDCLRAIAALAVVFHHVFNEAVAGAGLSNTLMSSIVVALKYFDLGRFGVLLFFIISGYCIANSILRPSAYPVASFAINRIARLYPAYWLSILAAVLVYGVPSLANLAVNIALLQRFVGVPDLLGVYWTLAVELGFYGLCVVLFTAGMLARFHRLKIVWVILVAYCFVVAFVRNWTEIALPYAWPWFFALMIGGAILRRLDDSGTRDARLILGGSAALLAVALAIAFGIYGDPAAYDKSWWQDFSANAGAILFFLGGNYILKIHSLALASLGRISYSIYLFHALVYTVITNLASVHLPSGSYFNLAVQLVASIGLTIVVAAFVYALVELPGIRFGRHLVRLLNRTPINLQPDPSR